MAVIQIYGKNKCFDTKKAERFFQERKIKFQRIDLPRYGMSRGELESVCRAVGGTETLLDEKQKDAPLVRFLAGDEAKLQKLLENPQLLRTRSSATAKPRPWSLPRRCGKHGSNDRTATGAALPGSCFCPFCKSAPPRLAADTP